MRSLRLIKLLPMKLLRVWTVLVALWAFASALPAAADPPPDKSTTRIVSLVPSLTELAFTLGAGDQVVGVSDYCHYPAEATSRPSVGGLVNPGLEATLRLRPTIVLLYRSQTDFASRLRQLGIDSELYQVDALSDMYDAIGHLGAVTGKTSAAATLATDIKSALEKVKQENASAGDTQASAVPGIVVVSRDPAGLRGMYQAAAGNFLGELFEIAGGRLVVSGGAAITREEIIRANPSIIIDMSGGDTNANAGTPRPNVGPWAELTTVRAVQSGQVYQWNNTHAMLLGPSVVNTVRQMKRMVDAARAK